MSRPPGTQGSAPPGRARIRTPELRAVRRRRVLQQGRILLGPDRLLACTVSDLSPEGARLLVPGDVALPSTST